MSKAIGLLGHLALLNIFVWLEHEPEEQEEAAHIPKQLGDLFRVGSELVLAGVGQRSRMVEHIDDRSISPSSSFEKFSPFDQDQLDDNEDWMFDWTHLSPSPPLACQRYYNLTPLAQYKQSRERATRLEEGSAWANRMTNRFPNVQYMASHRERRQPDRLTISISHTSMDTDVSSSVSPGNYGEAAGLNSKQHLQPTKSARTNELRIDRLRQTDYIPAHLRMPSQSAINMTFNRMNQSTLAWPSAKGAIKANQSEKAERCLLYIRGF